MRAIDQRLLKYAKATKTFLAFSAVNGLVNTALIILQALLLGGLLVDIYLGDKELADVIDDLYLLAAVFFARALSAWLSDVFATRASNKAKSQLRTTVISKTLELGPVWVSSRQSADLATLSTQGLNALDTFFARYLPQIFLAAAIPLTVGITVLTQDLLSAVIIGLTIPLIPFFMALVGIYSKNKVDRQWNSLQALSGHFLDLVQGLPTLKVFNRAKRQADAIAAVGDEYRSATMGVLRVSFLSSLVLELISTLSMALVAVSIGLRLVNGSINLREGLIVLFLLPEAYLPLRQLGAQFHAVVDGMGAADRMFEILEAPVGLTSGSTKTAISLPLEIEVSDVSYSYPNSNMVALAPLSFTARSGQLTAVKGASGSGKSTLVNLLLGFANCASGSIQVNNQNIVDLDLDYWRSHISYFPQSPWLPYGTVRQAIQMADPSANEKDIISALEKVGLSVTNPTDLPDGLDTKLTASTGLSMGQRRRIALARVILQNQPIFILDEPTASLDAKTEELINLTLHELVKEGKCVIAIAHRPHLVINADQVIEVKEPEFSGVSS
ncbi:MAG: hypothetical protein RIR66_966 [Actinomycetota bacterium]